MSYILVALASAGASMVLAEVTRAPNAQPPAAGTELLKYEYPKLLRGEVFARGGGTNQLLFRFNRTATRSGSTLNVLREFTYPDGKLAARERVVYDRDSLVTCELEELQIGGSGRAKVSNSRGKIDFEYRPSPNATSKFGGEAWTESALTGDMVGPFLAGHWEQLVRGESVKCRYLVIPRRETVGFAFVKTSESAATGRAAILVKMEVSSPFLAALVDPLFFIVEKAPPHRVLQYFGRTTPKVQAGRGWKDLDAVTIFDWDTAQ